MKSVQCVNLLSDDGSSVVVGPASQKKNFKNRLSTKNISNCNGKENLQLSSCTATQRMQLSYNSLSTSTDNSASSTSLNSMPLDTSQNGQNENNVINRVECPLCQKLFDDKSIVQHAAECQGVEETTRAHPKSSSRDSFYNQLDNLSTEDLNNILDFESQNSSVIVLDSQVDGVSVANQNKCSTSRSNNNLNGRLFSESEQLSPLKGFTPLDQLPPHEAEAYRNHINLHNNDGGGDVYADGNDIIKINYTYANAKKPYAQKKKSTAYGDVSLLSTALRQRSLLSRIVSGRRFISQSSNYDNNNDGDDKSQRSIKDMLKEDIRTIPNMLTMSRLLLSPAIGYWIYAQDYKFALGAFAFSSVTDLVDGYIARNFNQRTYLGTVLDPLADKVLMTTVTISLATTSLLPTYLAALIVGRDVLLSAAVMVYRYMSISKPRTFKKYIDPTIPSVEIKPTQISKYNTFLQLVLMGSSLSAPVLFGVESHWLLSALQYTVAASTVISGASYVFAKDAVKVLKQKTSPAGTKSPENKTASASSKINSSKVKY